MHIPLIGWRLAEIAPLAAGTTKTDTLAREVLSHLDRSTTITIRAQIDESSRTSRQGPGGGANVVTKTITFRAADAVALGYTPTEGDRLVAVKNRHGTAIDSTCLYLANPRRTGEGVMGAALWVAELSDGLPTRRDD